ncbi:pentatricopeptide repeat-containing protein At2g13600-like [Ananas comosus]|uniref:Pentatricopeptide repeat-containing protein At2g13600-like n=2 Tax=Ananas comosus TaxID=4615 RepID=A0A6P5FZZ9_ANACO|nr:pentatricopeptide repeat-containing protein At2g13600-like [Ananas comosus]
MIARFMRNSHNSEALKRFKQFQICKFVPDEFVLAKALSIAADTHAFDEGAQIHAFVVKKNLPMDVAANNSLLNLYFKCGNVTYAEKVFDVMPVRDVYSWTVMVSGYLVNGAVEKAAELFDTMPCRNTVSWNAMINGYQKEGCYEIALVLFNKMRVQGEVPNKFTFLAVLKAYTCLQWLENGKVVHSLLVKSGWLENALVVCTLMDMYAKCGGLMDVRTVFEEIKEHNVVSWSILMAAYAQNGNILEAEWIFHGMMERNVIAWNVMISCYVNNGMEDKALNLFIEMINGEISPNCFTFTSLLSGCSSNRYIRIGATIHGSVVKKGFDSETSIGNALITMYGEQGNERDARLVFDTMLLYDVVSWTAMVAAYVCNSNVNEACAIFIRMREKNLISWNTLMFGYLQNDKNSEKSFIDATNKRSALTIYYEMEQSDIKPDHFSYNCALSACATVSALEQARAIHCRSTKRGFDSDVGVGNALISVYGKCGCLAEAERAFQSMKNHDMISWNALLTGYSQNGRGNEVLDFYNKMHESRVEPNHVTFINLLSACSYLGDVQKGREYFKSMKDYGISPTKEHYACMVDLLGRAGLLREAEAVIRRMPVEPDSAIWGALLSACKIHGDPVIGERAADEIFHLEPDSSAAYIALAETYAKAGIWKGVAQVRTLLREKQLLKEAGCSWIEVRNQKHFFLAGDTGHLLKDSIHATLWSLYKNMFERISIQDARPP